MRRTNRSSSIQCSSPAELRRNTSIANINILFVDEGENEDNDELTDLVHQSESKFQFKLKPNSHRYHLNEMLSREESIEQAEEQIFRQARQKKIRERREFRLSGAPNPLVK
jgi:hypothetical protein